MESSKKITIGTTWYWQLQGSLRTDISVRLYDIDLFDTAGETIQQFKASGKIVICYFSAGTYESQRSDADRFKEEELGNIPEVEDEKSFEGLCNDLENMKFETMVLPLTLRHFCKKL